MSQYHHKHCQGKLDPVMLDPVQVYEDYYYPQEYEVIHAVEVIRRHHCVPVPKHVHVVYERDVECGLMMRNSRGRSGRR
ncbi:hypothetical protein [Paenibacillus kobensis]|uniref:hypothetical protein n=1 Tax=Paenibacillus kobensis TaxID=59841 RepID=UPI000FDB11E9|nr:hypothetical protein [Paenibacillus kobensis]